MAGSRQLRRRPDDPQRRKDPEGNRRAILNAAREEFGQHGFGGARVMRIAAAAGVSHQLITYHFGGKQGLYDALKDDWHGATKEMIGGPEPYAELVRSYVHETAQAQPWAWTVMREELEGYPLSDERVADLLAFVEQTKERQAKGEIRGDLDAGALTLAFFAASIAPIIMPAQARALTGADPLSEEFIDHYADQVAQIIYALAQTPGPASPPA